MSPRYTTFPNLALRRANGALRVKCGCFLMVSRKLWVRQPRPMPYLLSRGYFRNAIRFRGFSGEREMGLHVRRLNGLYILDPEALDQIYGPAERIDIEQHVDFVAPPQTRLSVAENP